ncbi:MAG: arylamine N-acetyltransferase [Oscillospiraceae bacterium]|nr:arylamine N-acetyltransferase [Oscillospiraceae bacterium]
MDFSITKGSHLDKWLDRIGYENNGTLVPSEETLAKIQYTHVTHVPYENLDIINGIPIALDINTLYDKIVTRRRGGYCFEINALFEAMLKEAGFVTESMFARFLRGTTGMQMRHHRVIRVYINGESFIADAGIGQSAPRIPVKLTEGAVQIICGEAYRFIRDPVLGYILQDLHEGKWRDFYAFTSEPQQEIDYMAASFWCEKSPDSPFGKQRMISIKTPDGRITIDGLVLKRFSPQGVEVHELREDEIPTILEEYFGISGII